MPFRRRITPAGETPDTEGHAIKGRLIPAEDDTEGNCRRFMFVPDNAEDTEGHGFRMKLEDADDTDGHGWRGSW